MVASLRETVSGAWKPLQLKLGRMIRPGSMRACPAGLPVKAHAPDQLVGFQCPALAVAPRGHRRDEEAGIRLARRPEHGGATMRLLVNWESQDHMAGASALHRDATCRRRGALYQALVLGCAVISLGIMPPSQAQEILDATQLNAIADSIRNYAPKDQFDQPPKPPELSGKRFSYELQPIDDDSNTPRCEGWPNWTYDTQKSQYFVQSGIGSVDPSRLRSANGPGIQLSPIKNISRPAILYLTFACNKRYLPSYTASNAYGATIEIKRITEQFTAIGFPGYWMSDGSDIWEHPNFWVKAAVGDEARHLVANVRLRISGTLNSWPDGRTLVCGPLEPYTPSFKFPYDVKSNMCVFAGVPEQLEFIDASNGEVLYATHIKRASK